MIRGEGGEAEPHIVTGRLNPCPEEEASVSESILVAAAANGDHAAFAALYNGYLDRIYRHCYWRCGNRHDAEDLTQQTFLKAWSAMSRFRDGGAPFVSWLLAICHNEIVNYFRKCRPSVELDPGFLACFDDPEAAVMDKLVLDAVRLAIGRLKPMHQQVIVLRYLEGYTISQVAAAVRRSESYVSVVQHRALEDLRRLLTAEDLSRQGGFPTARTRRSLLSALQRLASSPLHGSGET